MTNLTALMFSDQLIAQNKGFGQLLLDNIWYIILVLVFGAGLIAISVWSKKIKANDEKLAKELKERSEGEEEPSEEENAGDANAREPQEPETADESGEDSQKE